MNVSFDDLKDLWLSRPIVSRSTVIDEINNVAMGWQRTADDDDTTEDATTIALVVALLRKLDEHERNH